MEGGRFMQGERLGAILESLLPRPRIQDEGDRHAGDEKKEGIPVGFRRVNAPRRRMTFDEPAHEVLQDGNSHHREKIAQRQRRSDDLPGESSFK